MISELYSQHSFYSLSRQLKPIGPLVRLDLQLRANRVNEKINYFLEQRTAQVGSELDSYVSENFRVGIFGELGRGSHTEILYRDLISFLKEHDHEQTPLNSYWAVFFDSPDVSDEQFEEKLKQELSYLTSFVEKKSDESKIAFEYDGRNYSLYLGSVKFHIAGMHGNSSRATRRFSYSTLIFYPNDKWLSNNFDQLD